nr:MAG TPA: hypothetical protein [Caudoviricetes sp.]
MYLSYSELHLTSLPHFSCRMRAVCHDTHLPTLVELCSLHHLIIM